MVVVIVATNASPPRHKTHAPAFQTSGVRAENNVCPCLITTVEKEKMSCSSWSLLKFRRGRRPPALNDQIFKLPNKSKIDSESYAVTTTYLNAYQWVSKFEFTGKRRPSFQRFQLCMKYEL